MDLKDCIEKTLCLSTAHLSREDRRLVVAAADRSEYAMPIPLVAYDLCYGWLIHVHSELPDEQAVLAQKRAAGFSESFLSLLLLASSLGCCYLHFDQDQDTVDDLPIFDW